MKINFPVTLTAADTNKRTLTGRIVSWNERGNTSAGATIFKKTVLIFQNLSNYYLSMTKPDL